jgi:aromatic-L-amino-acid/L-tryptophan decarboxylase
MNPDEFRKTGHELIEWVAAYMEGVDRFPVFSQVAPGETRAKLPASPPEHGEQFEEIIADLDRFILPGITHWQSPRFFGFFPANASGPAILGDLISSGLGVQGMLWATSPACTELEAHVLDWLVEMLGLPAGFRSDTAGGGVIQDSASSASLVAALAARERATGFESNRIGTGGGLTAFASTQAHSSIEKAVRIAGYGAERLRTIEVDDGLAMRPDRLEEAIEQDRAAGLIPAFVTATVGTTSTTAVDPVPAIAEVCRRHGVWLHVDAAYAGIAALLPEMRWINAGLDLADSYCTNPHKWMLTNFDCTAFYVADRAHLIETLTVVPEYLRNTASESGEVIDYRDWQIPLGRRFRALKLWFVIRSYGLVGLRAHVRNHIELANHFASMVESSPDFEVVTEHPFGLVCFRHRSGDEVNQRIMDTANRSGEIYLTHTRVDDRLTLRLAIGNPRTERDDIEAAWRVIATAASG